MFVRGDQAKIKREGFSLLDMKRYLEAHGFEADGFEEPLDKLAEARHPGDRADQRERLQPFRRRQGRAATAAC